MPEHSKDNINDLVAEYSELLARYGPDSKEAEAFFDKHSNDGEFLELARVARELRITHGRRNGKVPLFGEKRTLLVGILMSIVMGAIVLGWVVWHHYDTQERQFLAEESEQYSYKLTDIKSGSRDPDPDYQDRLPSIDEREQAMLKPLGVLWDNVSEEDREAAWPKERFYVWAKEAYAQQNLKLAEKRVDEIKKLFPNWSQIHYFDGILHHYGKLRDLDRARSEYEKAIELNKKEVDRKEPPFPLAYNNLAILFWEEATREEPYDLTLLTKARQLVKHAIVLGEKISREENRSFDDRLLDTEGKIYEAMAKAKEQGADLQKSSREYLELALESYKTAELNAQLLSRRDKFHEKRADLERELSQTDGQ